MNRIVGEVIDSRYRLDERLGSGGMGTVYLGYHVHVCRRVAVKILNSKQVDREEVQRFYREARAAAAIGYKGIVDIFDVGTTAWGDPYLVMEYLEGEGLESLMERCAPFDLPTACAIVEQLLLSLAVAHERGIVHRDIKPGNIFVACDDKNAQPEVKLIDFGLSKIPGQEDLAKLTKTGAFLGTPAYVAPEQANCDGAIDYRADLYAVGVVLYEMLTGALPFSGRTFAELILKIVSQAPPPPQEVNASFPREAGPFLEKSLKKEPGDRFQTAAEMLQALRELCHPKAIEEGLVELGAAISPRPRATSNAHPFGEPESTGALPSTPPVEQIQQEQDALETHLASISVSQRLSTQMDDDPRRGEQNSKRLEQKTRRSRKILVISLGVAVVLLFAAGVLLFQREPEATVSLDLASPTKIIDVESPVASPSVGISPVESPASPQTEEEAPSGLAAPTQNVDGKPIVVESSQEKNQHKREVSAKRSRSARGNRVVPKPRRAEGPTSVPTKSRSRRFIKGGRETEIANDFE